MKTFGREGAARILSTYGRGASACGPSTPTELEARLAEARSKPFTAESRGLVQRLTAELTEAQRRERQSRIGAAGLQPSPPLPTSVGSQYRPLPPQSPSPGMRRRISTSTGEHIETGDG